jgi:hypothetical protein
MELAMTTVITLHLSSVVTERELDVVRSWSDWHQYIPTTRDRAEEKNLKVRPQVNGLRVVDEMGRFAAATLEERDALVAIFEEAQAAPMKKDEGMHRSTMDMEECWLYEQLSNIVFIDGKGNPKDVYVQTDVPRCMFSQTRPQVLCWDIPTGSMDEYVQISRAYQLREHSIGENRCGADWSEWHEDQVLRNENELRNLGLGDFHGFQDMAINMARETICTELPITQTHFSCTYDVWDWFLSDRRWQWIEDKLIESRAQLESHQEAALNYCNWCGKRQVFKKIEPFVERYVPWYMNKIDDLDRENGEWFEAIKDGVQHMQKRIQRELQAPEYCNKKEIWVGFMQYTQHLFWYHYKTLTIHNKARFEVVPTDEEREAIGYMLWLERLAWEAEVAQDEQHVDNWTGNMELQREMRQQLEFDSMWQLNSEVR